MLFVQMVFAMNRSRFVAKLSAKLSHLYKDNEILNVKTKSISATERPNVTCVQYSVTRRDVKSLSAPKNKYVKTYKDALSAGCVSLSRNQ
jgi:hypothetical protein